MKEAIIFFRCMYPCCGGDIRNIIKNVSSMGDPLVYAVLRCPVCDNVSPHKNVTEVREV